LATEQQLQEKIAYWKEKLFTAAIVTVSALKQEGIDQLFTAMMEYLPVHPPYFPKDELTDKPERFFAAEMIREKVFMNYKKEVPYSTEVIIEEFKEKKDERINDLVLLVVLFYKMVICFFNQSVFVVNRFLLHIAIHGFMIRCPVK
jgi:GTP-binding protein Era